LRWEVIEVRWTLAKSRHAATLQAPASQLP
jgi:hypothetical protein